MYKKICLHLFHAYYILLLKTKDPHKQFFFGYQNKLPLTKEMYTYHVIPRSSFNASCLGSSCIHQELGVGHFTGSRFISSYSTVLGTFSFQLYSIHIYIQSIPLILKSVILNNLLYWSLHTTTNSSLVSHMLIMYKL